MTYVINSVRPILSFETESPVFIILSFFADQSLQFGEVPFKFFRILRNGIGAVELYARLVAVYLHGPAAGRMDGPRYESIFLFRSLVYTEIVIVALVSGYFVDYVSQDLWDS